MTAETNAMIQPSREKYWEEKTDAEKIETLRHEVVRLARESSLLEKITRQLIAHTHGPNGELLAPFHSSAANQISGALAGGSYENASGVPYSLRTQRDRK